VFRSELSPPLSRRLERADRFVFRSELSPPLSRRLERADRFVFRSELSPPLSRRLERADRFVFSVLSRLRGGQFRFEIAQRRLERFVSRVHVVRHDELQLGLAQVTVAQQLVGATGERARRRRADGIVE
jgi:hypothetical protein